ncbi:MAG: SPOR domain-containing protein, partial [Burkholderiaceae bacterium]
PATPPAAMAMQVVHVVQVGSMADAKRAQALIKKLQDSGYTAYTDVVRTGKSELVRVRVRVAIDPARQALADALADLRARGLNPILVVQ